MQSLSPLLQALEALALAKQQLSVAEGLVRGFARQSVLDLQEYEEKSERLSKVRHFSTL